MRFEFFRRVVPGQLVLPERVIRPGHVIAARAFELELDVSGLDMASTVCLVAEVLDASCARPPATDPHHVIHHTCKNGTRNLFKTKSKN